MEMNRPAYRSGTLPRAWGVVSGIGRIPALTGTEACGTGCKSGFRIRG